MIRKAAARDVKTIHALLQEYGQRGELLARPLSELYDHLRDFWIFEDTDQQQVLGCCALQICWEDLAEIRSLAVHPEHTKRKIGSRLAETAIAEARALSINRIFTLTYRPGFFRRLDFVQTDRSELPLKIWGGCLTCVKFPDCDEIAMVRQL